jgi:hypothetical protein
VARNVESTIWRLDESVSRKRRRFVLKHLQVPAAQVQL